MLVRPAKKIMMSFPIVSACFRCPRRSPSPAATISVIDRIPHAIPNIVSAVRSLCAHSV